MQVRGADLAANFVYANKLLSRVRHVPGVADARIQQSSANPTLNFDVDRTRAQYIGLTERDVTNRLVVNLAGSSQVAPTYWLNPHNGVSYPIVMQTPQYQIDSLGALQTLPITRRRRRDPANPRRRRKNLAHHDQHRRLAIQYSADRADLCDAAGSRSRGRRARLAGCSRCSRQGCPER
jgi:multidrug efflux pump subunit AcrB